MTTKIQKPATSVDPWTELDRTFDAMAERFFEAWGLAPFAPAEGAPEGLFRAARTDVSDTGKAYRIVAEIPGIPKEKLDIRIRGTSVEIRGENTTESQGKDREFVHRERSYAGYYRGLELPEPVVATDATAKVENGLLELELPKQTPTPSPTEVKVPVQ